MINFYGKSAQNILIKFLICSATVVECCFFFSERVQNWEREFNKVMCSSRPVRLQIFCTLAIINKVKNVFVTIFLNFQILTWILLNHHSDRQVKQQYFVKMLSISFFVCLIFFFSVFIACYHWQNVRSWLICV